MCSYVYIRRMKTKMMQTCEVLVEMDARDLARVHIKKHPFSPEFNEPKYIVSQSFAGLFTDFTPIILFNNYWRQEWMDAAAWYNFLKYKNCYD